MTDSSILKRRSLCNFLIRAAGSFALPSRQRRATSRAVPTTFRPLFPAHVSRHRLVRYKISRASLASLCKRFCLSFIEFFPEQLHVRAIHRRTSLIFSTPVEFCQTAAESLLSIYLPLDTSGDINDVEIQREFVSEFEVRQVYERGTIDDGDFQLFFGHPIED